MAHQEFKVNVVYKVRLARKVFKARKVFPGVMAEMRIVDLKARLDQLVSKARKVSRVYKDHKVKLVPWACAVCRANKVYPVTAVNKA